MTDPTGTRPNSEPDPARLGFSVLAALGVAVLLIVAGAAVGVAMGTRGGTRAMMWGGPDARVEAGAAEAPTGFTLDGMAAHMVAHYGFARGNPRVYEQIPCYCGCQEMLGHRNLEDCFVTPDGAWDSHASGCQVCIDESQMVMRMMGRGMGMNTIRDRVIAAYENPIG
jgi:hypothetical protein